MSTYYGYAEREAEDNIDWSVVGSDITKMLQEEVTRREVLKKEIDDASRKFGQTLSEAPTGTHKGANDFITGFTGDVSQARLMQDRLLKSGQLKVKDYLLQRANLTDGTKGIFNVAKKFQAEFKRKADRMTQDESAKLEQTLFQMTEGFANFNNSGAYINPTNFQVSLAKKERVKDKDGNFVYQMSDKPQDFFTVNELNTFVSVDLDRFKTSEALDEIAKSAGVRDQSIVYYDSATQLYKTVKISDVTGEVFKNLPASQQKLVNSYKEAEEDAIDNILANKYNAASILTDYVGKGYDFTFDPKEAAKNDKLILLEKDPGASGLPKVTLSASQEKVIRETLSEGIKFRLDQTYEETGVQKREQSAANRALSLNQKKYEATADTILKDWVIGAMGASNETTSKASYDNITTLYNEINQGTDKKQIRRINKVGNNSIQIVYTDGTSLTPIPLGDKKAYMRTIKGLFPEQFNQAGYNDNQIENKGSKIWKQGKGGQDFNLFNVSSGIQYQPSEASALVTEKTIDGNSMIKKTATQEYKDVVDDSLFGRKQNKNIGDKLALIGQRQISAVNSQRKKAGLDNITVKVESDGSGNLFVTNPDNNAQIKIDFYDSKNMSNAQEKLMSNILNYQNGLLTEDNLEGAYRDFLEIYKSAISQSYVGGTADTGNDVDAIFLNGVKYSYNDMLDPSTKAFETLINMAKGLKQGETNTQAPTTTQSTSGGATDPFGNPIK